MVPTTAGGPRSARTAWFICDGKGTRAVKGREVSSATHNREIGQVAVGVRTSTSRWHALASRNHGGWPLAIGREEVSVAHRLTAVG
eukprot:scaffold242434_cov31-Tisochrysis_lutea.AAC.1